MRRPCFVVLLLIMVVPLACSNRSTPVAADGTSAQDSKATDAPRPGDTFTPIADAGRPGDTFTPSADVGPLPDSATPNFCAGQSPRAAITGVDLPVISAVGHSTMTSCCEGETIRIKTGVGSKTIEISFSLLRFPNAAKGLATVSFSKPPSGYSVTLRCDPFGDCDALHAGNADIGGWMRMTSMPGMTGYNATLCLDARPKPAQLPKGRRVQLWLPLQLVSTVCAPGFHQTCNANPMISSLRGKCIADGTCKCDPGAQKMPNGKCR